MSDDPLASAFFAYLDRFIEQYDDTADVPTSVGRVAMRSLLSMWRQRLPHVDVALMQTEVHRLNDILGAFGGWLSFHESFQSRINGDD